MLRKNLRVKNAQDIDKIFKKGQTVKEDFTICKYLPNELENDRAAFTVSKKLKLNAAKRNRVKRQLSHAYKEAQTQIKTQEANFDLVFILSRFPEEQKRFESFQNDIKKILEKIKNV